MIELTALYNGTALMFTNLSSRGDVRVRPYPAQSGLVGAQVARFQGEKNRGPIVEGTYTARVEIDRQGAKFTGDGSCLLVRSAAIQKIEVRREVVKPPQFRIVDCAGAMALWGTYRWRLEPDRATAERIRALGRDGGFHIHGGGSNPIPGTSGCIKVGDEFWSDLLAIIEIHVKTLRTLRLTVKYASPNTRTGG